MWNVAMWWAIRVGAVLGIFILATLLSVVLRVLGQAASYHITHRKHILR